MVYIEMPTNPTIGARFARGHGFILHGGAFGRWCDGGVTKHPPDHGSARRATHSGQSGGSSENLHPLVSAFNRSSRTRPSGFGGVTLNDFVDRIFVLTEVVGPDHAALGTDMDANFRPTMSSYRQLPLVVSELLRRGYGEANVAGLVGGNFRRLFDTVWRSRRA